MRDLVEQDCVYPLEAASRTQAPRQQPPCPPGEQFPDRSQEADALNQSGVCIYRDDILYSWHL